MTNAPSSPRGIGLIVLLAVIGLLSPSASAQRRPSPPQQVQDPLTADIVSLHLHMTAKEAATALSERFKLNIAPCAHPPAPRTRYCYNVQPARMNAGKQFVELMDVSTPQFRLSLTFTENYPYEPNRPETLTQINYQPTLTNDAARQAFLEQVKAKYGPPRTSDSFGYIHYCVQAYEADDSGHSPTCVAPDPVLHVWGGGITADDQKSRNTITEAWNKRQGASAPPL